jgi:arylsulfatase A-like enzyme
MNRLHLPSLLDALVFSVLVFALDASPAEAKEVADSRPNIVFVLADDMGWAQPGFNGGNKALTPNIDKLASEGMKLTQFYAHSVCAPTRGALLTGRYAFRNWMDWRSEDFGKPSYLKKLGLTLAHTEEGEPTRRIHALDTNERTIAEALKEAGYFTALVGKWHCGEWLEEHLPMQQGFMHQYGHYAWGIDYYTKTIVHNAPARFAVYDWHRNQRPLWDEGYTTDLFAAEAERVIARQDKERLFFLYVPFNAVHGPLNEPPRYSDKYDTRDAMMFIADWFSTFITLVGGKHEQELPVDAIDMTEMLFDGAPSPRDEIIFEVAGSVRLPTIRSGDYKLMGNMLFNIKKDPRETIDIAGKHPKIASKLAARLAEIGKQRPPLGNKPLLMDPPLPYIYGREENENPPQWLRESVKKVRATQPKHWSPGATPWPQAPKGAHASN